MIFGDPYEFAILIQNIPEWEDGSYRTGVFHFIIDGKMFPEEISPSSLGVDVRELEEIKNNNFAFPENCEIFSMDKESAFKCLVRLVWPDYFDEGVDVPEDFDQSYIYKISIINIEDAGCLAFWVACGDKVRILAAKTCVRVLATETKDTCVWKILDNIDVYETIIHENVIIKTINDAIGYYYFLKLFDKSIAAEENKNRRYALDASGNVHRFSNSNDGAWYWFGSTKGKDNALKKSDIPSDVKKALGLPEKRR